MVTLTNVVDQRGLGARRLLAFEHEHLFHIDACACPALEGLDVGAAGPEEPGHVSLLALHGMCRCSHSGYVSLPRYVSLLALHLHFGMCRCSSGMCRCSHSICVSLLALHLHCGRVENGFDGALVLCYHCICGSGDCDLTRNALRVDVRP